jgi:hypothetical protein
MDDSTVRERVRQLLINGELPTTVPDLSVGGPGNGEDCPVCMSRILTSGVEVEIADDLALHPGCYLIWSAEAKRFAVNRVRRSSLKRVQPSE